MFSLLYNHNVKTKYINYLSTCQHTTIYKKRNRIPSHLEVSFCSHWSEVCIVEVDRGRQTAWDAKKGSKTTFAGAVFKFHC